MGPMDIYFFVPGVASPLIEVGESLLTSHGIRVTRLEYKHLGINYNICTYLYYMKTSSMGTPTAKSMPQGTNWEADSLAYFL